MSDRITSRDVLHSPDASAENASPLRYALAGSPQPIWVYDVETLAFLFVNDAAVHHYGYARDEFMDMTILDIRPAEDSPSVHTFLSHTLPTYRAAGTWQHRTKDGTVLDVSVVARAVTWEGKTARILLLTDITEHVRVARQLQASETRFRELFERNPQPMWICDFESLAFLAVNDAAIAQYGYSRDEFRTMTILDVRPIEDSAKVRTVAGAQPAGELVRAGTWRHRRKDGTLFYVEVTTHEIVWQGRRARFALLYDVTERVTAAMALQASEARYRQMFENHPAMQLLLDPASGTIIDANPAACAFYGYSRAQLTTMNAHQLSARPAADVEAVLARASAAARDVVYARPHLASGEIREVEIRIGPVESDGRQLLFAIIHDITEQTRAEEILRRERFFLSAVLEHLEDGVVACDADGVLTLFNRATREFHGLPAAPIPPEAWAKHYSLYRADGVTLMDRDEVPLFRALQGEVIRREEMVIAPTIGPPRTLLASGQAIVDAQGRNLGAMIAMHDITEQRQAEARLKRQNAHLTALHEISLGLVNQLDVAEVLDIAVRRAAALFGTPHGYLALVEDGCEKLVKMVSLGAFETNAHAPLRKGEGVAGTVWETGQPLMVSDYRSWPGHVAAQYTGTIRAIVGVPLRMGGDVGGVLGLAYTEEGRTFDAEAIQTLRRFADLASVVLENARLYRATRAEIRDRQKAEASLVAAQQIAHIGSWDWDLLTGTLSWSDELFRIFGVAPGAFTPSGKHLMAAIHPDDRGTLASAIEATRAGEPFDAEMRFVHANGETRFLNVQATTVRDAGGAVVRIVGTAHDITPRRRAQERLHRNAYYDPLTGLPNRTLFIDLLTARAQRKERFAVLFLDLDRFKRINDSLGHVEGDRLLSQVAERLREVSGPGAVVARFGEDEFSVLLEGTSGADDARRAAQEIHDGLRQPLRLRGLDLHVTASIGIAIGRRSRKAAALLRDADIAMYRAKEDGRGRTVLFDATMRATVARRLKLEADMQVGLAQEQFRLVYQPIVALATGAVVGFEALARWEHPRLGAISPEEFIPIAEESGFIVPLGEWVLRAACAQLARWHNRDTATIPLTMGVNLSGRQIEHDGFAEIVARTLVETGIPPASLHLEITERMLVDHTEATRGTLQRLRALGVGIYLDDFGMEYSALSYLRRFPIDAIKIDRSFVAECTARGDGYKVMAAMVGLAHSLGIGATAEGIESKGQLACVRELGCERGQGYVFARPLSADEANAFATASFRSAIAESDQPAPAGGE